MRRWSIGLACGLLYGAVAAPAVAQGPGYSAYPVPPPYSPGPAYPHAAYGGPPPPYGPPPGPPVYGPPASDASMPYGPLAYPADPASAQQGQDASQPTEAAAPYPPPAPAPPAPLRPSPYPAPPYAPPPYGWQGYAPPPDAAAYGPPAAAPDASSQAPPAAWSPAAPPPADRAAAQQTPQRLCVGGLDLGALLSSLGLTGNSGTGNQNYTLGTYMYGPGVTQSVPYNLQPQITPYNIGALPRMLTGYDIPVQGGQPGILIQQPISLDPGGTTNLTPSSGC